MSGDWRGLSWVDWWLWECNANSYFTLHSHPFMVFYRRLQKSDRTLNKDIQGFKSIILIINISYLGKFPLWFHVKNPLWLKFNSSWSIFHMPPLVSIKWGLFCLLNLYVFLNIGQCFWYYSYLVSFVHITTMWSWYCSINIYFLYSCSTWCSTMFM